MWTGTPIPGWCAIWGSMSTASARCAMSGTPTPGATERVEPWSVVFTDLDTGAILDVVDGPRAAAVKQWLRARPRWWRKRVELVAIDMSNEFRSAAGEVLPKVRISADHWHVIRLAN